MEATLIFLLIICLIVIVILSIMLINTRMNINKYIESNQELHEAVNIAENENHKNKQLYKRFSRDIKTLLHNVVGFAALGVDETSDRVTYEYFSEIINAGNESNVMIDYFNNMVIYEGRLKPVIEYVSINNLLSMVDEENFTILHAKNQELKINTNQLHNAYARIDGKKMKMIINNVLQVVSNHADIGSEINLSISNIRKKDKSYYKIDIISKGKKIPALELKYLNNPLSVTLSDESINSNLGFNLITAKYFIDILDGRCIIDNIENGNFYTIELPFIAIQKHQYENSIYYQEENKVVEKTLEGKKILLVEDNDVNARIVSNILEKFGMKVERVDNGKKALLAFHHSQLFHYDFILMDIRMPEMDGLRATNAIRKIDRSDSESIPIIGLSAIASDDGENEALEYGMNDFLSKPIDINKLKLTLEKFLK